MRGREGPNVILGAGLIMHCMVLCLTDFRNCAWRREKTIEKT